MRTNIQGVEFHGYEDLRYGYFWPYRTNDGPPALAQDNSKNPKTEPLMQVAKVHVEVEVVKSAKPEVEERKTITGMPAFAVTADSIVMINPGKAPIVYDAVLEEIDASWD